MTKEDKVCRLIEKVMNLSEGTINESTNLKELSEWDSLSMLEFITDFYYEFKKTIRIVEIEKVIYVNEIFVYIPR